jgi:transcriptional regulator with XRE-family HTH domain
MLGERLKWVRKDKGLTQKAFSEPLGTSSGYISEVEQGKKTPGSDFLVSLSRVWGVGIDWLLTGVGNPYPSIESKPEIKPEKLQSSPESSQNKSEITDAEIIEQFSDKKYARELSLHLVELERLSSEAFKKVDPYIKGLLDGLRMKPTDCCGFKGTNRRSTERRVKDKPGKFKGAKDRRSGKDRRVAVQR